MKNEALNKLFNGWKDTSLSIRKLNDKEKRDWKEYALHIHATIQELSDEELVDFFEEAMSEVEQQEIAVLVTECELIKRAKKQNIQYRILNALPSRKAVEAVKLAFPRYKANSIHLF